MLLQFSDRYYVCDCTVMTSNSEMLHREFIVITLNFSSPIIFYYSVRTKSSFEVTEQFFKSFLAHADSVEQLDTTN